MLQSEHSIEKSSGKIEDFIYKLNSSDGGQTLKSLEIVWKQNRRENGLSKNDAIANQYLDLY